MAKKRAEGGKASGSGSRARGSGAARRTGGTATRKPATRSARSAETVSSGRTQPEWRREVSAGGVVYRREAGRVKILLAARRTQKGELAWGLAKGGLEPDESLEEAAAREVWEETGILADIEESLGDTRYFYVWDDVRVRKTVHFFLMRTIGGDLADRDDEMEDVRWFPLERALKRAAYRGEREVLQRAAARLR